MPELCVTCSRPFCRHDAARYEARALETGPVETETGERLRLEATRILTGRFRKLADDSKTYAFSPIEATVMEATGKALDTLTAMAPVATLVPFDSKDWFSERLPLALPQS